MQKPSMSVCWWIREIIRQGQNKITVGQTGMDCVSANYKTGRQQEPVKNREGLLPVALYDARESPKFTEGEDVNSKVRPMEYGK